MLFAVHRIQPQRDLRQQCIDGLVVLGVFARAQCIQADGAEHRTGIYINVAQLSRQTARQRGFARTCRPIDRNRNHVYVSLSINYKLFAKLCAVQNAICKL